MTRGSPLSIDHVNPVLAVAIAFLVGAGLSALVLWLVVRERPLGVDPLSGPTAVRVPVGVSEVLSVLRSSAIVVGPHDEVLQSSLPAQTHGLVRGSRLGNPELLGLVRSVRADRQIREVDLELGAGGGAAFLSARVAPLSDELVLVLADDRTAERRIEETRRDFVANISHELKTPIGAIALLAEALQDASDDPEGVRRFSGRLTVESTRLNVLVSQIIDLSRLQADDPLAQPEVVDVDRVLAGAIDLCRVEAGRRKVALTVAGEVGLQVLGSERQLVTAVGNLVENAIVYSDPRARVAVAARREAGLEEDYVEITVSDNGIGIAAADLDRVFERFYRVDYARSRENGGTGLGLAIVKHVAASHRGEVSVWSQPGRGSTFTLRIPMGLDRSIQPLGPDHDAQASDAPDPAPQPAEPSAGPPIPSQTPQEITR